MYLVRLWHTDTPNDSKEKELILNVFDHFLSRSEAVMSSNNRIKAILKLAEGFQALFHTNVAGRLEHP